MKIEACSQQNFGSVKNTIGEVACDTLMRRVGRSGEISKLSAMLQEQASNPVNIDFFLKEGVNPRVARLRARVSIDTPYFKADKVYKQGIFSSAMRFFEKMCKKADKMNEKRESAKQRYDMFVRKHSLGCGEHSSINALEE